MTQFYIPRRRFIASSAAGGFVGLIKPARAGLVPCGGSVLGIQAESADGTSVTTVGPMIWDALGNSYAISPGGKILFNGTLDHDPGAGVVQLVYHLHQPYQFNGTTWYTPSTSSANWASTTSPILTGGGNNSGITPLFWDDFSEASGSSSPGGVDWTTRWWGYPQGLASSYIDQSDPTLQADARSVRIVLNAGNYYLINSTFPFPADATTLRNRFGAGGYCAAEIVSKLAIPGPYYFVGRCKQPISPGVMGAWWAFRASGWTRDQYEELDATENPSASNTPNRPMVQTIHYGPNSPGTAVGYYDFWSAAVDSTHWHIYAWEYDAFPGNCTAYLDGAVRGVHATPASFGDSMNLWISIYQSPGSNAWFGNTDGSTIFPSQSVYDWVGAFNNKAEADTYFAANPQYNQGVGGTDGPSTTGVV